MTVTNEVIIDPWTPLDYKAVFGRDSKQTGGPLTNAPWLSARDRRRMAAYLVLAAYQQNTARRLLTSNPRYQEIREYGDPSLVIEQAKAAVLGDAQTIVVDGAETYDPDLGAEGGEGGPTPDDVAANEQARIADEWQTRLREWADAENLDLTVLEGEGHAVGLGDAVYVIRWDGDKGRPRVQAWDPGFYFPVESDASDGGDFVERVHFVWETPPEMHPDKVGRLVRLTYEMGPIEPAWEDMDPRSPSWGEVTLHEGDRINADGRIERDVAWSDEPVTRTCYMSQREWRLNDYQTLDDGRLGADALDIQKSTPVVRADGALLDRLDLRIDFLPVVHLPNTWPGGDHFGQSVLTKAAQVLDDLQAADTDTARAQATTGSPIIAASGVSMPSPNQQNRRLGRGGAGAYVAEAPAAVTPETYLSIRPGMILTLGENGRLTTVDTASNLSALRENVDALRSRMTQNVRIPDVALGIVGEAANSMSGLAIELRYGPMQSLVRSMRRVRAVKYALLLKFAQRLMLTDPEWDGPAGPDIPRAEYQFGAYMPRDLEGTITRTAEAYGAGIISRETAVKTLQQAGMAIEDALEEVERIESRDFDGANRLADATNDQEAVRAYLRLPEKPVVLGTPLAAQVTLPATGGQPSGNAAGDDDEEPVGGEE